MISKEALAPKPAFEIPTVNEGRYMQIRKALARKGYTFVVAINPESIDQLATNGKTRPLFDFDHVDSSREMRSNVPPRMKVVIDSKNFRIEYSAMLSPVEQLQEINEQEAFLKEELPKNVRDVISMLRPSSSILAQLDFEHQKRTGRVLFTNWFGCTGDRLSGSGVACVGRNDPTGGLRIGDWNFVNGLDMVYTVSAVVLPRKLAA